MKGWLLTTAVIKDTPYYDQLFLRHTHRLFSAYAQMYEMDYKPQVFTWEPPDSFDNHRSVWYDELMEVAFTSSAPRGTEVVYASIPQRRRWLDEYDGVVFLDSDMVIVDFEHDICHTVSDRVPIGSHGGAAVVVMRSNQLTKAFLDTIWAMRERYRHEQWLEQAAMIHLLGYCPHWPGGDGAPEYLGDTAWTPYHVDIGEAWNHHPWREWSEDFYIFHPSGVQPFSARMGYIEGAARLGLEQLERVNGRAVGN